MKASVNMSTQLIISWFRKVQEELDSSSESVSNTNIVFSAQIRAVLVVSNVRYLYVSFVFVCNLIWAGFKGKKNVMPPTSVQLSGFLEGPCNHFQ